MDTNMILSLLLGLTLVYTQAFTAHAAILKRETNPIAELHFKNCPKIKPVGKLIKATFNGTKEGEVALLKKGTTVMIEFTFESSIPEDKLTSKVWGVVAGVPVRYPLDHPDACSDSGLKCPVAANKEVKYQAALYVKPIFPAIGLYVEWALVDKDDKYIFCGVVPAKVQG